MGAGVGESVGVAVGLDVGDVEAVGVGDGDGVGGNGKAITEITWLALTLLKVKLPVIEVGLPSTTTLLTE